MDETEKKRRQFRASSVLTNRTYLRQEKQPGRAFRFGVPCRAVFTFSRKRGENTNQSTAWRFTDDEPSTTLIIHKYIEGTENEPLSGVGFKVVDGSGAAVGPDDGVYYTDKAGEIVLDGIEPGTTVIAREFKTVEGFVLDGTPQDIKIEAGRVQQLTFWNKRAGTLVIEKKDKVSGAAISGAEFQLTYAEGGYVDNDNRKRSIEHTA